MCVCVVCVCVCCVCIAKVMDGEGASDAHTNHDVTIST